MTSPKKTVRKKVAAKKTPVKKAVAPKATAKKTATAKKPVAKKTTNNKPVIKKGSKLACHVCGFAITVDNISGIVEEDLLICCDTPMHHKTATAKKK
jgi:hypothetical protein